MLQNILYINIVKKGRNIACFPVDYTIGGRNRISKSICSSSISKEYRKARILFADNILYFSDDLKKSFKKCIRSGKRFIISLLFLRRKENNKTKRHLNILFYDRETNILERFEPNGGYVSTQYNALKLDKELECEFRRIFNNLTYYRPIDFCPNIGLQRRQI